VHIGTGHLLAAHVRSNPVHMAVDADRSAEQVMNALKSYASRGSPPNSVGRTRLPAPVQYVICEQGVAMAVFESADAN
jgi:hypothetical protein